jgi:hypothetical protein
MNDETQCDLSALSLAKLWREIALYLEIWDLIRRQSSPARA